MSNKTNRTQHGQSLRLITFLISICKQLTRRVVWSRALAHLAEVPLQYLHHITEINQPIKFYDNATDQNK